MTLTKYRLRKYKKLCSVAFVGAITLVTYSGKINIVDATNNLENNYNLSVENADSKNVSVDIFEKDGKGYVELKAIKDVENVSISIKVKNGKKILLKEAVIKKDEVVSYEIDLSENDVLGKKVLPKTSVVRETVSFSKIIKSKEATVNVSYDVKTEDEFIIKEQPKVETKPVEKEQPKAEAKPVEKEQPKAEAKPVEKEQPKAEVKPVEKEQPKAEVKPFEKEQPKAEVKPVEKEQPKVEIKPVEKEQPKAEVKPVEKEQPKVETKPVEKELPKENNNNYVRYYSQNDYRWGSKIYGLGNLTNTGCVPASLSMILSTTFNKDIPVTQIANKLYNETSYFNKKGIGTYAEGVQYIFNSYGLNYKVVYNVDQLKQELLKGNMVYAAVDNQPFTINGYSHAVVLRGLDSNGNTTVYNPYTGFGSVKNYNINTVWQHRSKDVDNLGLGSPFISVVK